MANSPQATKRAQKSKEKAAHNASQRSGLRTSIKKLRKLIQNHSQQPVSEAIINKTFSVIDKSVSKGLTHRNKAARLKSRFCQSLRKKSQSLESNQVQ